jgi:3-keto-disaccharide hydrolase
MRRLTYVLVPFVLAVLLPFTDGGEFKLEPGFTLVFNGKNFDGWQPKGKKEPLKDKTEVGRFKVVDGTVHFNSALKGESYIETTKEYTDVHVKFDFKPGPKCNNDFFIRGIKFDIVPDAKADSGVGKENKAVKKDGWNTMEIIAKGDTVEHKINGEVARTTKMKAKAAPFIMRAEIGEITVKNIRVKE